MPQSIVLWYARHVRVAVLKIISPFTVLIVVCCYSTELSLQLSPLTGLSAHRVCVLWNSLGIEILLVKKAFSMTLITLMAALA